MGTGKLISREEVLDGMRGRPLKRAATALTLIENQTARWVAQSQPPVGLLLAETTLKARNQAFLEAIALGREAPVRPTIQEIERYAPQWASLAPVDPSVRAAVANLLATRYRFTQQAVPQLRLALGLDSTAVQQAYQRLFAQPVATLYVPQSTLGERWHWGWATIASRLEGLPPFWITFVLNLPGAAGLLALPIALAQVGLTTGILLLLIFGLLNLLTAAALAETVARSGTMRFGLGFLGQLMQEYLGNAGSFLMTVTLALNNFFVLIIFYVGVAGTLADATRIPTVLWIGVIFVVCLYFLSRKSINATVATTLLIVFVNIFVLILIPLLALPHFQLANFELGRLPWAAGTTFTPATWGLLFGILLSTYFSHMQVATYGSVILRRDPSARTWIRGSAAAILFYMVIACAWLIVLNGVIPEAILMRTPGTVLAPLAERVGPIIHLLGAWLVIFSMGLTSVQIALGLYYLVQERLPAKSSVGLLSRLSERRRFWLAVSPVVVVFLLAEWVALTGFGTFTSLLGILSALLLPLIAGIFPVLLLAATRRKGDFVPGIVYRFLGNSLVLTLIYLFFLTIILIHGLLIWQNLAAQAAAILVALGVVIATFIMLRRGAFHRRLVIEVCQDAENQAHLRLLLGGERALDTLGAIVQLGYSDGEQPMAAIDSDIARFSALRSLHVQLPATSAHELKIWAHRMTPTGDSVGLPISLITQQADGRKTVDQTVPSGQAVLSLDEAACRVDVTFQA